MTRAMTLLATAVRSVASHLHGEFDATPLIGLAAGVLILGLAASMGGGLPAFLDAPSLMIVLGGTLCGVLVCTSAGDALRAGMAVASSLRGHAVDPTANAAALLRLAAYFRRHGPLAIENLLPTLAAEPFLQKALRLVVDGCDPAEIERLLQQDSLARVHSARASVAVLRRAAELAPAMGLIGTLIGLVQMLGAMTDPGAVGPGMALALLTTLYGAVLANVVMIPLAGKLEREAGVEALIHEFCALTAISMARRENPRRLEIALGGLLPPGARLAEVLRPDGGRP